MRVITIHNGYPVLSVELGAKIWWWYTYNHEEFDKESDHEEFDKEIIDGDDHGHGGSVKRRKYRREREEDQDRTVRREREEDQAGEGQPVKERGQYEEEDRTDPARENGFLEERSGKLIRVIGGISWEEIQRISIRVIRTIS
ncbi:hypothetical protein V8G54_008887 [Vigna mungo]|uniref:Uncharacterized protein n=1 Tax=Vigna mungo TaxID=3915 RepID=A0AAQ3P5X9_VIGMU